MNLLPQRRSAPFWSLRLLSCAARRCRRTEERRQEAAGSAAARRSRRSSKLVETAAAGQPAPADFPIQFQNDFLKAQEGTHLRPVHADDRPVEAAASTGRDVHPGRFPRRSRRATGAGAGEEGQEEGRRQGKRTTRNRRSIPFEDAHVIDLKAPPEGQPIRLSRALSVPGRRLRPLHRHQGAGALGRRKDAKNAPYRRRRRCSSSRLPFRTTGTESSTTSTLIMADKAEQLKRSALRSQTERPYALGSFEITTCRGHAVREKGRTAHFPADLQRRRRPTGQARTSKYEYKFPPEDRRRREVFQQDADAVAERGDAARRLRHQGWASGRGGAGYSAADFPGGGIPGRDQSHGQDLREVDHSLRNVTVVGS